VNGPFTVIDSNGASSSPSGTKFVTCGGETPGGNSARSSSRRSRIASRVICTSAFGSSSMVRFVPPSEETLEIFFTPRTPCTAASIGEVR
jgi:hypothetical protein